MLLRYQQYTRASMRGRAAARRTMLFRLIMPPLRFFFFMPPWRYYFAAVADADAAMPLRLRRYA